MPRTFPDDTKVKWAEGKIGPRGSVTMTHRQRALARTWLQGRLHASYQDVMGVSLGDMTAAYNDTTDAALEAIRVAIKALTPKIELPAKPEPVAQSVGAAAAVVETPAPVVSPENGKEGPWGGPSDDVRQFFRSIVGPVESRVNQDDVRRIAAEVVAEAVAKVAMPERLIVVKENAPDVKLDLGVQHFKLPLLIAVLRAGMHAYLVGPAGTGKTTAAHAAEKALAALEGRMEAFNATSFYGTMTATALVGYRSATGEYIDTAFHQRFVKGGTWTADEVDAGNANGTVVLNAALANGAFDFPNGRFDRHPAFRCVACANTIGQGANRVYVGRNQIDAATLDRFCFIDWPIDEGLESALLGLPGKQQACRLDEGGILPAQDWLDRVRKVRAAVEELAVRHLITPRAAIFGSKLFAAGIGRKHVEEMVMWRGLDAEQRARVEAKAGR